MNENSYGILFRVDMPRFLRGNIIVQQGFDQHRPQCHFFETADLRTLAVEVLSLAAISTGVICKQIHTNDQPSQ